MSRWRDYGTGRRSIAPRRRARATVVLALLGAVAIVVGCVSTVEMAPPVGPQMLAAAPGTDVAALQRGRGIYLTACARCHNIEPIGRYSQQQWRALLPEMIAESKLDAQQAADVEAYLLSARAAWSGQ